MCRVQANRSRRRGGKGPRREKQYPADNARLQDETKSGLSLFRSSANCFNCGTGRAWLGLGGFLESCGKLPRMIVP